MNDTITVNISKKWQMLLWKVFLTLACIFMVVELIMCMTNIGNDKVDLGMSGGAYITLYVVVPFLIYAAALTGTLVALKKNKLTDNGADWLVSLMMFTVLAVPAFEHYNSIILVLMPTIAIVITAIFANQNITIVIALLASASLIINEIHLHHLDAVQWICCYIICIGIYTDLCNVLTEYAYEGTDGIHRQFHSSSDESYDRAS